MDWTSMDYMITASVMKELTSRPEKVFTKPDWWLLHQPSIPGDFHRISFNSAIPGKPKSGWEVWMQVFQ